MSNTTTLGVGYDINPPARLGRLGSLQFTSSSNIHMDGVRSFVRLSAFVCLAYAVCTTGGADPVGASAAIIGWIFLGRVSPFLEQMANSIAVWLKWSTLRQGFLSVAMVNALTMDWYGHIGFTSLLSISAILGIMGDNLLSVVELTGNRKVTIKERAYGPASLYFW
jgi:hypothetical protein